MLAQHSSLAAAGSPRGIKEGGTFRVAATFGSFNAIDPALANVTPNFFWTRLAAASCGTRASRPPAGLRLTPDLAEAEPIISKNGKTYTFTIRKDARFSDGRPVTARAFAHALERILDPAMESFSASSFADIVGAQDVLAGKATTVRGLIAKGRTLTLRLTKRVPELPDSLTGVCAVPPDLPADPEGAKAPLPEPGALLRRRVRPQRAAGAGAEPLLPGRACPPRRSVRRRPRGRLQQATDQVATGTLDSVIHGIPPARAARAGAALRRQQVAVLRRAGEPA